MNSIVMQFGSFWLNTGEVSIGISNKDVDSLKNRDLLTCRGRGNLCDGPLALQCIILDCTCTLLLCKRDKMDLEGLLMDLVSRLNEQ